MAGSYSEALQAPSYESDSQRFLRILTHDDRDSFYIISSDAGGQWTDTALKAECLPSYQFDMVSNYYVTHNGFTGKRRLSTRTRQLNAIYLDMDCHSVSKAESDVLVTSALDRLNEAVRTGVLPRPTMIVSSGRGLHVLYVLDRSIPYRFTGTGEVNEQGLSFFAHVQNQLADVIEGVLDGLLGLTVDRAVFDHTRVSRIPGTFNKKAGCFARLVSAEETYYSLSELNCYKPAVASNRAVIAPKRSQGKPAVILKYNRLMMARLNKLSELQAYRGYDCEGTRELMSFVYYNTAVQIYGKEDAWDRLLAFNSQFKAPIALSELEGIERAVSEVTNVKGEKGFYVLSADTLVRLLAMTEKEMLYTQFFASKRMVERMEAKRKTKEKREARNERIVALYKSGTMTQQQIADEVGCGSRTVYSVLKEAGLTRGFAGSTKTASVAKPTVSLAQVACAALDKCVRWDSALSMGSIFHFQNVATFWHPCSGVVNRGEELKILNRNSFGFSLQMQRSWARFELRNLFVNVKSRIFGFTSPLPCWIGGSSLSLYGTG